VCHLVLLYLVRLLQFQIYLRQVLLALLLAYLLLGHSVLLYLVHLLQFQIYLRLVSAVLLP
jgi:hypothetical protein